MVEYHSFAVTSNPATAAFLTQIVTFEFPKFTNDNTLLDVIELVPNPPGLVTKSSCKARFLERLS